MSKEKIRRLRLEIRCERLKAKVKLLLRSRRETSQLLTASRDKEKELLARIDNLKGSEQRDGRMNQEAEKERDRLRVEVERLTRELDEKDGDGDTTEETVLTDEGISAPHGDSLKLLNEFIRYVDSEIPAPAEGPLVALNRIRNALTVERARRNEHCVRVEKERDDYRSKFEGLHEGLNATLDQVSSGTESYSLISDVISQVEERYASHVPAVTLGSHKVYSRRKLEEERDELRAKLTGAEHRAKSLLGAKDYWSALATKAKAERDELRAKLEGLHQEVSQAATQLENSDAGTDAINRCLSRMDEALGSYPLDGPAVETGSSAEPREPEAAKGEG